ncbi:MAG: rod shape-determining protein [Rikenellaceae bacterium]|nr:rod shape-determining protein [Rikenellaceae bacterium]MBP3432585.1 rod shape-determining protein [Alistipes sp.]
MGLFSLTQELAIDLGTANTLIVYNDEVVVDEPSVVAVNVQTGQLAALGREAQAYIGRTNQILRTIRPLKDGVIADFNATELMLRGMIRKIKTGSSLFSPSLKMVICIPSGSTNVEIRAVRDSAEHAGGREVAMIYEPMAAALGAGIDVEAPEGNMIIDIGGGTSEIACISLGGIVCSESINVAGDVFTADIMDYVRQQHSIRIGERTAEEIKCKIGAAVPELEDEPEDFVVTGPSMLTALPQTITLSYNEIAYALDKSLVKLDAALMKVLQEMPAELYSDVVKNGIYLAGGGALIKGLDKRLSKKTGIQFHIAEDPLRAVVRGTNIALKNINLFSFLMR